MINIPDQFKQIRGLYASDFLKEFEAVKDIAAMPVKKAMILLEEGHNLFLESHQWLVTSIEITTDNKYIVSCGGDCTVRI